MSSVIQRSYDSLSELEQRLFCALAVFVGGFELEAAEAIGIAAEIPAASGAAVLSNLVLKSLVVAEPSPSGTMRYRLLEPLREFALDRLDKSSTTEMRQAHAAFFLDMSRQANLALTWSAGGLWWPALNREHDNLYATLLWLIERQDTASAQIVATAACEVWRIRGQLGEARALLARVMSQERDSGTRLRRRVATRRNAPACGATCVFPG
jgi:predicted ATPase